MQVNVDGKGSECGGEGAKKRTVNQVVTIPKGVNTGTILRIPKMGGNNGDLLVEIEVGSHPFFKREEYDIHTTQLVTISQAVLGTTIEVPTIHDKRKIQIKPGTSDGAIVKINGCGIPKLYPEEGSCGNHYVHIKIKIPNFLNAKQQEAMKAYAALEDPIDTKNNV